MGNSAAQFASEKADLSKVRVLPEVLSKLGDYELAVFREWLAKTRPGPSASGMRRPEFLMRPVKPVRRAFYVEPPAE